MRKVYLDNAATTPIRKEVQDRLIELVTGPHGNPSSTHQFGRKAKAVIEEARRYVASAINCTGNEIVFTSGGTEADNMAIVCSVRDLGVKRIITSPIEHHAVLHSCEAVAKNYGVKVQMVNLLENGEVDLEHLETLLKEDITTLVSLMHANNEVGNMLDLKKVGTLCRANGAYFHTDTVQTIGHYPVDVKEMKIDFLAASAHKFYGPKGVGFFYADSRLSLHPFIEGGSQERNRRGGTENLMGIGGLHTALEYSLNLREEENARIFELKNYLAEKLTKELDNIAFNGRCMDSGNSLCSVLSVRFMDWPSDGMHLFSLDMHGIGASGGSACTSGSNKGSHVMEAVHPEVTCPVIRFSIGKDNNKEDMDYVVEVLKNITANMKAVV